ncbi:MAG: type II toxin-antitoxin system VapC family toxin [Deltaproteobacteria bacterium]|nr:type II toxin-antitoxin system VapC family toxin [Deltaproteobacteria bacterium]
MQRYIVDTSITAKLFLLNEKDRDIAQEIYYQSSKNKISLLAPSLTLYELTNTFVKKGLSPEERSKHLSVFQKQIKERNIEIVPPTFPLLEKSAEIAETDTKGQGHVSAYDAVFHALALLKKAVLLTADKAHYRKTNEPIGSVLLLEDFK